MEDGRAHPRQKTAQWSGWATGPVLPSAFSPRCVCSEDTLPEHLREIKHKTLLPFDVLAPNTAYKGQFCFSFRIVIMPRGFYCNTSF